MTDDIAIRRIGPDALNDFKRIRLEALRVEPLSFASTWEDWVDLSDEEWLQRMREPVFLAFKETEPVSIMGLLRQTASKMAHRATLIMVYVRKSERGSGLAARMLEAVTTHARENGILQLELVASAENPAALAFYEKQGFREVGRIPGGFRHEGREYDDVVMVKRIAE